MARRHGGRRPSLVRIALLLLAGLAAAVVVSTLHSAADPEDAEIRISVHYPTEEESRWLDRWAEKYRAKEPGSGFSVQPATEEESAYLNGIFSDGKNGGGARAGFDGRIEFDDNNRPYVYLPCPSPHEICFRRRTIALVV